MFTYAYHGAWSLFHAQLMDYDGDIIHWFCEPAWLPTHKHCFWMILPTLLDGFQHGLTMILCLWSQSCAKGRLNQAPGFAEGQIYLLWNRREVRLMDLPSCTSWSDGSSRPLVWPVTSCNSFLTGVGFMEAYRRLLFVLDMSFSGCGSCIPNPGYEPENGAFHPTKESDWCLVNCTGILSLGNCLVGYPLSNLDLRGLKILTPNHSAIASELEKPKPQKRREQDK